MPSPFGSVCSSRLCDGAEVVFPSICDGHGACGPAPRLLCAPFACDATSLTCKTTCTSNADCAAGLFCLNGLCGRHLPAPCTADAECASGFCSEGVCCNGPCQGACVSCALPGKFGVCSPVDPGTPDPRRVCQDQGAATCGMNGQCDGAGGCQKYPAGTVCVQSVCGGGQKTNVSACDGNGSCVETMRSVCWPYTCRDDGAGCRTACDSQAACAENALCSNDGRCFMP
jgi:hypothetical protein